jgi:hypothetical protein
LANKLDNDPGVSQNDFLTAIGSYSAIGSTVNFGNPTVINEINHNIQI